MAIAWWTSCCVLVKLVLLLRTNCRPNAIILALCHCSDELTLLQLHTPSVDRNRERGSWKSWSLEIGKSELILGIDPKGPLFLPHSVQRSRDELQNPDAISMSAMFSGSQCTWSHGNPFINTEVMASLVKSDVKNNNYSNKMHRYAYKPTTTRKV